MVAMSGLRPPLINVMYGRNLVHVSTVRPFFMFLKKIQSANDPFKVNLHYFKSYITGLPEPPFLAGGGRQGAVGGLGRGGRQQGRQRRRQRRRQ